MSNYYKDPHIYDDIINLPHHRSKSRPPMSLHDRAAQFAPFAALSGYEEAVIETARLTDTKIQLDETAVAVINEKLYEIAEKGLKDEFAITHFRPDARKNGGVYLTDVGIIKKIETIEKKVILENGLQIAMEHIVEISKV